METILAIDYGLARIGLAISRVGLADPLKVIYSQVYKENQASDLINDKTLMELLTIIETEKVERLVVGVSEQKMATRILRFVDLLKEKINLPIETVDETLSSYEVKQRLNDLPKKKRIGPIDHYAAALILENYLELC